MKILLLLLPVIKHFSSKADSDLWINEIIAFGKKLLAADKVFVVEHLLLRPRIIHQRLQPEQLNLIRYFPFVFPVMRLL